MRGAPDKELRMRFWMLSTILLFWGAVVLLPRGRDTTELVPDPPDSGQLGGEWDIASMFLDEGRKER